jgi:hypothetical protein
MGMIDADPERPDGRSVVALELHVVHGHMIGPADRATHPRAWSAGRDVRGTAGSDM